MTSLRFKLILLFAVIAVGCAGCSPPMVSGRVTDKQFQSGHWELIGSTLFYYPDKYSIRVRGKNLSGEVCSGWVVVDESEYDAAKVGDLWADGWHVAKAKK